MITQSQTLKYDKNGNPEYGVPIGGTCTISGKIVDQDEQPVNITGSFAFTISKNGQAVTPVSAVTISKATDTTTGQYVCQITPANTTGFGKGLFDWIITYTHSLQQVNKFTGKLYVR